MSKRGKLVKQFKVAATEMLDVVREINGLNNEEDITWAMNKLSNWEKNLKGYKPPIDLKKAKELTDDLPF